MQGKSQQQVGIHPVSISEQWTKSDIVRKNILNEWVITDKTYIDNLNTLENSIVRALVVEAVITQQEMGNYFPEVKQIRHLSQLITGQMHNHLQTFDPSKTQIANTVKTLAGGLNIYKQYNIRYQRAYKVTYRIDKHPKFKEINSRLGNMSIDDYWCLPTQRPFKYLMLLRRYLQNTNPNHIEYQKLSEVITRYDQVLALNDLAIQKSKLNEIMVKLEFVFGDILSPSRNLITVEKCSTINFACTIYIFSDLILVIRQKKYREVEIGRIYLDQYSYTETEPDGRFLKNRLYVMGSNKAMQFTFQSKSHRSRVYEQLKKLQATIGQNRFSRQTLIEAKTKQLLDTQFYLHRPRSSLFSWIGDPCYNLRFRISVTGVIRRPQGYQYVVKFRLPDRNIYQIIVLSKTKFQRLKSHMTELYYKPRQLVSNEQKKGFYAYIEGQESKVQQHDSIVIQEALSLLFKNKQLVRSSQYCANFLNMSDFVWDYISFNDYKCTCRLCTQSEPITRFDIYENEVKQCLAMTGKKPFCPHRTADAQREISEISNPQLLREARLKHRLLWVHCKMGRINTFMTNHPERGQQKILNVQIPSFPQKQIVPVAIFKDTTARDAIQILCQVLNCQPVLSWALQLRMAKEKCKQELYCLDGDQNLYSLGTNYNILEQARQEASKSLVTRISKFIHQIKITVRLRKLLKVDFQTEKCEIIRHRTYNLDVLCDQIYQKYHRNILFQQLQHKIILCALYYSLYLHNKNHGKKTILLENYLRQTGIKKHILKRVMPEQDHQLLNSKFLEKVEALVRQLLETEIRSRNSEILVPRTHLPPKNQNIKMLNGLQNKNQMRENVPHQSMMCMAQNYRQQSSLAISRNNNWNRESRLRVPYYDANNYSSPQKSSGANDNFTRAIKLKILALAFSSQRYITEFFEAEAPQNSTFDIYNHSSSRQTTSITSMRRRTSSKSVWCNCLKPKSHTPNGQTDFRIIFIGVNYRQLLIMEDLKTFNTIVRIPLSKLKYNYFGITFFIGKSVFDEYAGSKNSINEKNGLVEEYQSKNQVVRQSQVDLWYEFVCEDVHNLTNLIQIYIIYGQRFL